jgi:hypothetical protein
MNHPKPLEEYDPLMNHLYPSKVKVHRHHVPPYMDQYYYCTELHGESRNLNVNQ